MTRDKVVQKYSVASVRPVVGKIVGGIVVVALTLAVLALIPQTRPIGVEGSRAGASNVAALVRTGTHLGRGQTVGRHITEADINGYFYGETLKRMNVDSFSTDIVDGAVKVRMVRTLTRLDVGSYRLQPKVSCEVTFIPAGNRMRFAGARQGLLPLTGPLKVAVIRQMYTRLSALPEWSVSKNIGDIEAQDNSLDVTLQRQ